MCVLNALTVLQLIQFLGSEFQLLITLLLNTNFLTSNLNLSLNNFVYVLLDHGHQFPKKQIVVNIIVAILSSFSSRVSS